MYKYRTFMEDFTDSNKKGNCRLGKALEFASDEENDCRFEVDVIQVLDGR